VGALERGDGGGGGGGGGARLVAEPVGATIPPEERGARVQLERPHRAIVVGQAERTPAGEEELIAGRDVELAFDVAADVADRLGGERGARGKGRLDGAPGTAEVIESPGAKKI